MRNIIICSLLLSLHALTAQYTPTDILLSNENEGYIGLESNIELGSGSVDNPFFKAFYNGDFLSADLKKNTISKLKHDNHLGLITSGNIIYQSRLSTHLGIKNTFWTMHFGTRAWAETKFNSDIFALYFNGNANFENKTISLTPFEFNLLHYSDLKLGFNKQIGKMEFGLNGALLFGHKTSHILMQDGSLFTAPYGEYINLNTHLYAEDNELNKSKLNKINGHGFGFDVHLRYILKKSEDFTFNIENIGYINWNNNSQRTSIDTTYRFEGYTVQNLFDSIYIDIKSEEDLKNDFLKKEKGISLKTKLPYQISFRHRHIFLNDKVNTCIKIQYFFSPSYKTLIEAAADFKFLPNVRLGAVLGAGGYSNFNAGLYARFMFMKRLELDAHYSSLFNDLNKDSNLNQMAGIKCLFLFHD